MFSFPSYSLFFVPRFSVLFVPQICVSIVEFLPGLKRGAKIRPATGPNALCRPHGRTAGVTRWPVCFCNFTTVLGGFVQSHGGKNHPNSPKIPLFRARFFVRPFGVSFSPRRHAKGGKPRKSGLENPPKACGFVSPAIFYGNPLPRDFPEGAGPGHLEKTCPSAAC